MTRVGEILDAVAIGAELVDFALGAVGLGIALEMAEEADHLAFEKRRAAALTRPPDDLAGGLIDGEEVGAVDSDPGQAEAGGAVDVAIAGHRLFDRGRFRVAVVLDDEDRRAGSKPPRD